LDNAAPGFLMSEVVSTLRLLRAKGVPVEINLRSNEYLVMGSADTNATTFSRFSVQMNVPVILCTDNDGIMEMNTRLGDQQYESLAAEYAYAIASGVVIDAQRLADCLQTARRSCFERLDTRMHVLERKFVQEGVCAILVVCAGYRCVCCLASHTT
jgi:hypothetical protein